MGRLGCNGFNDIALVVELAENDAAASPEFTGDERTNARWFYWYRLRVSHFGEVAHFLRASDTRPEVAAYIASLPDKVQAGHRRTLEIYEETESFIKRVRNEAAFHYPRLSATTGKGKRGPVAAALASLAPHYGRTHLSEAGTIKGSRNLFADDVLSVLVLRAAGGQDKLNALYEKILDGEAAFMRFANPALDEYLHRAATAGGDWRMT